MDTGEWLSLGQLLVGILGFGLAFWQLWRTASAVERTEARLKMNELLFELPQLHRLEQDLDNAARDQDVDATIRVLNQWRSDASSALAFLRTYGKAGKTSRRDQFFDRSGW